jgi:hypothetical protein
MSESKKKQTVSLNLKLPEDLGTRYNSYITRVVAHQGYVPFGIKTTIAFLAIKEWLDKNENKLDIDFSRPTGNRKH